jgi:esterase/lipase
MNEDDDLVQGKEEGSHLTYLRRRRPGLFVSAGIAASIPVVGFIVREVFRKKNKHLMQESIAQFSPVSGEASFMEARPRHFGGKKKPFRHAVLLLHGFSSSPMEFSHLIPHLENANIPYYAPLLTGYGMDDFRLLYQVQADDWRRDAALAYELLSSFADEVSVVGHSTGANLALYVASKYPVRRLILSAANLAPSEQVEKVKKMVNSTFLGALFRMAMPVVKKPVRRRNPERGDTLDPSTARKGFGYRTIPIQSVRALWKLQDETPVSGLKFNSMHYLYGLQDLSVNNQASVDILRENRNEFTIDAYCNSAHNILEDFEKEAVFTRICEILNSQ